MFPFVLPIRYLLNPKWDPSLAYGPERSRILNKRAYRAALREISSWKGYEITPLLSLDGMAEGLGIKRLWYKDEGARLGLGSFKSLGGTYGVFRVLKAFVEGETGVSGLSSRDLMAESFSALRSTFTVTCASAGNHGRAVAKGANMFGCQSVVFLPAHTSPHRVKAIQDLGAVTHSVEGGFDDAVARAAQEGKGNGWTVVADTSYPGYEEVPRYIMQGYAVLAGEVLDQVPTDLLPTHVFLQAGVGGLAAAVTGHLWEQLGPRAPKVVVVEPAAADCLMESALMSKPSQALGSLDTVMDCLACRRVSQVAWQILAEGASAFLTISDHAAEETVRILGEGRSGDLPIRTQPSGAAGLGGLISTMLEPSLADPLGLGETSRVLVIGSEGPA